MGDLDGVRVIARNRKARHDYEVLEQFEAGIVLRGAEVKSLRDGKASFTDSYGRIDAGEAWLHNLHIPPYDKATIDAPDPVRPRKLLLRRREIDRLRSKTRERADARAAGSPFSAGLRQGHAGVGAGKKHRERGGP